MLKLDEESRIRKLEPCIPETLEDVVDCFFDQDSDSSNLMEESGITADITMTTQNESFMNNKFKKNIRMPEFDNSKNKAQGNTSNMSLRIRLNTSRKKFNTLNINKINTKDIKIDEIDIKDKFSMLKDKFKNPSRRSSRKLKSTRGESLQSNTLSKSLKKGMIKSKSSTQTSKVVLQLMSI